MSEISFITMYKEDILVSNIVKASIPIFLENHVDISSLVNYLIIENKKITKGVVNWTCFVDLFKKNIKTLMFIRNYINMIEDAYEDAIGQEWLIINIKINDFIHKIKSDRILINNLLNLYTQEKNINKRLIISAWMELFFENTLSIKDNIKNKKLNNSLLNNIHSFQKNKENALWKERNSIFIPNHQKYLLKGLAQEVLSGFKENAKKENKNGWLMYLEVMSTENSLKVIKSRFLREKIYKAFNKLNTNQRKIDNNDEVLSKILLTRQKTAELNKYDNYAQFVLSNYILNTTEKAYDYLNNIKSLVENDIDKLYQEIKLLAKKDNIRIIRNWDVPYYVNMVHNKINFPKNDFSDYFIFDKFMDKFMSYLKVEFKLDIKQIKEENILKYELNDEETGHKGFIIVSPFDNNNKVQSACTELCTYEQQEKHNILPSVQYITLQIEKEKITKINFAQLKIILHEFGHALHGFYANKNDNYVNEKMLSWDLVEIPSQFLEHLIYDKEFMKKVSSHYETNKKISIKCLEKNIQKEQYLKSYEIYGDIKKNYAKLTLHENIKKLNIKSPNKYINGELGCNGLIYNITTDYAMLSSNYLTDYSTSGYIYLYSEFIAYNLIKKYKGSIKKVFTNIFNSVNINKMQCRLQENVDLNKPDLIEFNKKGWNIKLYGDD